MERMARIAIDPCFPSTCVWVGGASNPPIVGVAERKNIPAVGVAERARSGSGSESCGAGAPGALFVDRRLAFFFEEMPSSRPESSELNRPRDSSDGFKSSDAKPW